MRSSLPGTTPQGVKNAAEMPQANIQAGTATHDASDDSPGEAAKMPATDNIAEDSIIEDSSSGFVAAELVAPEGVVTENDGPQSWPVRLFVHICGAGEWLFGAATLFIGLAVLASIPVLQFLSLGYLLEVSGRVARSGRLRDGFIGMRRAARVGSLVLGTWIMFLPLRLVTDMWYSAQLIDPYSGPTVAWRIGQIVLTVLILGHIVAVWYCGGRLRQFFWPAVAPFLLVVWGLRRAAASRLLRPVRDATLGAVSPRLVHDICNHPALTDWFVPAIVIKGMFSGRMIANARDAVWDFCGSLRIPYYFWLGLRGFVGAAAWLAIPLLLLIGSNRLPLPPGVVSGLLGGLLLVLGGLSLGAVLLLLPFLQTRFAAQQRFGAMFEIGSIFRAFFRAPIAFWFALLITLLFALPLYLLKIEATPREVTWLASLVFVAFIWPARLLTGWSVGRGIHRPPPRLWGFSLLWSFLSATAAVPVVGVYVLIVYATQYVSWYGGWSLLEQHAFLVPAPFFGL